MEAGYLTNFIPNFRALKHCSYYQLLTDRPLLDKQCDYIILNSKSKNLFQPSENSFNIGTYWKTNMPKRIYRQ